MSLRKPPPPTPPPTPGKDWITLLMSKLPPGFALMSSVVSRWMLSGLSRVVALAEFLREVMVSPPMVWMAGSSSMVSVFSLPVVMMRLLSSLVWMVSPLISRLYEPGVRFAKRKLPEESEVMDLLPGRRVRVRPGRACWFERLMVVPLSRPLAWPNIVFWKMRIRVKASNVGITLRNDAGIIFMKCSTKKEVKSSKEVDAINGFNSKIEHLCELPIFGNYI